MNASETTAKVIEQQRAWATGKGVAIDQSGRAERLGDNLFMPLNAQTHAEFDAAAGNELKGDLRSLRSSAALVCNFFDPWRKTGAGPLGAACAREDGIEAVSFERKFPTGLSGLPPHLDVLLEGSGATPIAIESKFTEPYGPSHNEFRDSYFEKAEIWDGLARCRAHAETIHKGSVDYSRLGAAQLLKHTLGLARAYGPSGFVLVYLWYDVSGDAATAHRSELETFSAALGEEIAFRAMTYQEVADVLRASGQEPASGYFEYLTDRYGL